MQYELHSDTNRTMVDNNKCFCQNLNDTINVVIDLKQVDSLGLRISVSPPKNINGTIVYTFPKTIPGIYRNLQSPNSLIKLHQNKKEIPCVNNSFSIDCSTITSYFSYSAKSSVENYKSVTSADTYFLKDSIYLLNWQYLLGFFQNKTDNPYKIKIIKNNTLHGSGTLNKELVNDTVNIFTANNYEDLIQSPLVFSIADTTSFKIGDSRFHVSCVGYDTLLNAQKIKDLLISPLKELLRHTEYNHKNYTFIYFSEYAINPPSLMALEHPNSTLVCYNTALRDSKIIISASIHEYIHAIYAPLRIRSEVINKFDFTNPTCDEFLWFYEGVTEYLTTKTLLDSKFLSEEDFLNEIEQYYEFSENFNLSQTSLNIYNNKEQKLFVNYYTTGSLFALQLDLEIIKTSDGTKNLLDVMKELQSKYTPETPFNSKTFNDEFIAISGIEKSFLRSNTEKKIKINFAEIIDKLGYYKTIEKYDTLVYSFSSKKQSPM